MWPAWPGALGPRRDRPVDRALPGRAGGAGRRGRHPRTARGPPRARRCAAGVGHELDLRRPVRGRRGPPGHREALYDAEGDRRGLAWVDQHRAWVSFVRGDVDVADARLSAAAAALKDLGDRGGVAWALGLLAYVRLFQGPLRRGRGARTGGRGGGGRTGRPVGRSDAGHAAGAAGAVGRPHRRSGPAGRRGPAHLPHHRRPLRRDPGRGDHRPHARRPGPERGRPADGRGGRRAGDADRPGDAGPVRHGVRGDVRRSVGPGHRPRPPGPRRPGRAPRVPGTTRPSPSPSPICSKARSTPR